MNTPDMSLRDSLQLPRARLKNPKYYMVDDELVVDHVIRYEHLDADLAVVMSHLGLASALDLPRANGAYRKSGDYRGHFDDETRDWVAQAYTTEIDLFGYRFETPDPLLLDGRIKSNHAADSAAAPSANTLGDVVPRAADQPPSSPSSPDGRLASRYDC
jgi:hypothetical protein